MAKPVYALVGSEPFLQLQKLREVLAELPADAQRVDLDGERAELSDVLDELRSFAMFGGGKVVIIRSADVFLSRFREPLEDYVAAPCTSSALILRLDTLPSNQRIYKAIAKVGRIERCEPPKDLSQWVIRHAMDAHRLSVALDAAAMLADLIGSDLGRLDTELAKLALSAEAGTIGPQAVCGAVPFQRERQMWDMTNELACGRPSEALLKWRQLTQLDSTAEFRAVTWLGMWLENVRKALALKRRGMSPFAIAQQLRIWPREIQGPFFQTAEALGDTGVVRATDLLAEVDLRSKSGLGDASSNVERFILEVGRMQSQPA